MNRLSSSTNLLAFRKYIHRDWQILRCYPQGCFDKNSLTQQLNIMYPQVSNWCPLSRLDRVTSGLMVLGCGTLSNCLTEWNKGYLALVSAQSFRNAVNEPKEHVQIFEHNNKKGIICKAPILTAHNQLGTALKVEISDSGKSCLSIFWPASESENNIVLMAIPFTGRTHQLRAHLNYCGCPITDDHLYNSECLKDTKNHNLYVAVSYSIGSSIDHIIRSRSWGLKTIPLDHLKTIKFHLNDKTIISPEKIIISSHEIESPIHGVYLYANAQELHRDQNVLPDFGVTPDGYTVSLHPVIEPWSVNLTCAVHIRPQQSNSDGVPDSVKVLTLPRWAQHIDINALPELVECLHARAK